MKEFIVISHTDGLFIHVEKQFDTQEDAMEYARLACLGDNIKKSYEVFCRLGGTDMFDHE